MQKTLSHALVNFHATFVVPMFFPCAPTDCPSVSEDDYYQYLGTNFYSFCLEILYNTHTCTVSFIFLQRRIEASIALQNSLSVNVFLTEQEKVNKILQKITSTGIML